MEETRKRKILIILFFGLIASLFAGFIFTTIYGPQEPRYRRLEEIADNYRKELQSRQPIDKSTVFLPLGERVSVDNNVMVYRGLENNLVRIDVFISALDPQTPYHHAIPKNETGKEIRLGGQSFTFKSITAAKLKLKRVKN